MTQDTLAIETGSWDKNTSWELFLSDKQPPAALVTAVFCIALTHDDKIVLARSARGWGVLGGHIEDGETIADAIVRESVEEGGFTPAAPHLFAYRKITALSPTPHPNPAKHYPFPVSYLLYYWATTDAAITRPTGQEIIESGSFNLAAIGGLATPDLSVITPGYKAFKAQDQ